MHCTTALSGECDARMRSLSLSLSLSLSGNEIRVASECMRCTVNRVRIGRDGEDVKRRKRPDQGCWTLLSIS